MWVMDENWFTIDAVFLNKVYQLLGTYTGLKIHWAKSLPKAIFNPKGIPVDLGCGFLLLYIIKYKMLSVYKTLMKY